MKKNSKGFTLVELLAVIVILGILVVFSIPLMLKYINYSKSKTYIMDANKLISIAEYKINSNSLKIEKPDPGNCIVLSYDYLNDGSIKNPPGKGSYLSSASYVVVKNSTSGKLEYSAALIEEVDGGGYSGLILSSPSQMNTTFGFSRVDNYDRDELIYINDELCEDSCINTGSRGKLEEKKKGTKKNRGEVENVSLSTDEVEEIKNNCKSDCSEYKMLSRETINENIGSEYVNSIEKIYTEDDLEQGVPGNAFSPKIVSAYVENGDINIYNSTIKMRVNLVASDKDSNQLNVCVKSSETDDFSTAVESCENYISGNLYVKEFDFPLDRDHPDKLMYFSISVTDENGNSTSTSVSKAFTKNSPPVVNASVSKRNNDRCNTYLASVHVNASDDRDLISSLRFCINNSEKCESFMDYGSFFDLDNCDENGNNCTYDFNVGNGGVLDGKDYDIYVHVMDSNNQVTTSKLNYKVFDMTTPTINFSLKPDTIQDKSTLTYYNRLSGEYDLNIDGTCSFDDKIKLIFTSSDGIDKKMTYADYLDNYSNRRYEFSGNYDGKNRIVNLSVIADYGVNISKSASLSNVYVDKPPVIDNFSVRSQSSVSDCSRYCSDGACSSSCDGGSVVNVNFDVVDDLDTDFRYCITEDAAECDIDSNFKKLSDFNYTYSLYLNGNHPYTKENSNRKLYLMVKDSMNNVSDVVTADYKLYANEAPVIFGNVGVYSLDDDKNINEVMIDTSNMTIIDDFDDYKTEVCYTYGGVNHCTENISDKLVLEDSFNNAINDSSPIPIFIRATDGYDEVAESSVTYYEITPNAEPIIIDTYVKSTEEDYNSNIFDIYYKVYDPDDTYSICLSEDSDYEGCVYGEGETYFGSDNNNKIDTATINDGGYDSEVDEDFYMIKYESNWDYNYTTPKELYLYVVDSSNNVDSEKIDYTLYKLCDNTQPNNIKSFVPEEADKELTYYTCGGNCFVDPDRPFESKYIEVLSYQDKFIKSDCGDETIDLRIQCDHPLCLKSAMEPDSDIYNYVIGNTKVIHPFQEEIEPGNSVACSGYYRLYNAKADTDGVNIIHLFDDYTIACAELVGVKYKIRESENSNADEKYIRIDDRLYIDKGLEKCTDDSSGPCLDEGGDIR